MSEKVTIEHGNEFINRMKELKWDDVKTCKNITDLYVNSVLSQTPVDYSKCIVDKNLNNKKT